MEKQIEQVLIVYRYDGDVTSDELQADPKGELLIPPKGSTITRKGKQWLVVGTMTPDTPEGKVPEYVVFLKSQRH